MFPDTRRARSSSYHVSWEHILRARIRSWEEGRGPCRLSALFSRIHIREFPAAPLALSAISGTNTNFNCTSPPSMHHRGASGSHKWRR